MSLSARHGDDAGGMAGMGDMPMSAGMPSYFWLEKMFWVVIGSAIAFATLINILNKILFRQRLRSLDAKPKSFFWTAYATSTAICREITSAALPTYHLPSAFGRIGNSFRLRTPSLGRTIIVLSYLIVVLVFCFYKYDLADQWSWEDIAYRCGCIAQAQLPLIFLLAGKQTIVGSLVGMSYERLQWLHQWTARILWLTATLHLVFWFRSWARYDYIKVKLTTDSMTQTGFAAWCILTAIVIASFAPVRRWNYELFLVTHIVLFAGLLGATMIHVDDGKNYVWACVALYLLDRVMRFAISLFLNLSIFHRGKSGLWANKATLTPLPGNVTRISIDNPSAKWKPGQHMFVSCHSVVPLQSHPFTIASLPSDGKMEFIVQAQNGGTKRFHRHASKFQSLPEYETADTTAQKLVGIEGPYGRIRPLPQFDSVVFFAGSTGATYTVPLMRDIVHRWRRANGTESQAVTKKIKFVWAVKSKDRMMWFQEQLERAMVDTAMASASQGHLELDISIYVTCDEELDSQIPAQVCAPKPSRGQVELAPPLSVGIFDEKKTLQEQVEVKPLSSDQDSNVGCAPDGSCCCKKTVDEEGIAPVCCCSKPRKRSIASSSGTNSKQSSSTDSIVKPDSRLKILSGRPHPRTIIRRVLEEAEGESAIVVCGPQGLQDNVRRSVVSLSDERAVHKGTGAQGMYLHVEGFSY